MTRQYSQAATRLATKHYLGQLRADWRVAIPALVLPGIGNILVFYAPAYIVAIILTRFGRDHVPTFQELLPYILLIGGVWMLGEAIWRVAIHFLILVNVLGMRRLYAQAMDYLLEKDLSFFHSNFAGSLTKKTVSYARNYEGFSDTIIFNIVSNIPPLIFIAVILWKFSPLLILTLVALMTTTFFCVLPFIRRRQKLVEIRENASTQTTGHIADTISNIDAVRAFAHERFEADIHKNNVKDWAAKADASWNYQNRRVDIITSPFYVFTNVAGLAIAVLTGGHLAAVFLTFSYYANFTRVMWEFNRIYRNLENHIAEAAQFTELLLQPPVVVDPPNPKPFRFLRGDIEFRNVGFHYHDAAGDHLFDNFNLRIKSGERVGLVGRSGGGKTTVTKLLLRFMDVDQGEVLIDGQNIAEISQKDLRSVIAYVPQDPIMFHRSIRDNIRYGRLEASAEDIFQAARLAHAAEFIERLSHGYETKIGERGVKLSGGQRQRIAIARAMVKNAPVLVLDEATSALDSENENLIQDALWKLMEKRTAIVIAHRLSTVQRLDRIIVLEEGNIVEEGNHAELLARGGQYAELWTHQTGGLFEGEHEQRTEEEEEPVVLRSNKRSRGQDHVDLS